MKKFMIFFGLVLLMATAAYAAPPYEVMQSDPVQIVLTDAPEMTVDFVLVSGINATITIATTADYGYFFYQAMPIENKAQVFDIEMPVFRLCIQKMKVQKSNIVTGWRGQNSNPPNQYDRA